MAAEIRSRDPILEYPQLVPLLGPGTAVLDVGCGTGWFGNALAYHYDCPIVGIDFNPVAVEFARRTAAALGVESTFHPADLFLWEPEAKFDVVVSLGVLHHTNDCEAALDRLLRVFVRPRGHALVGLYHRYGRRPFLEHFDRLRSAGASEAQLYEEFRTLFGSQPVDADHCRSWFRDQVLHPHETQHTLRELLPVIQRSGAAVVSTSLNGFQPVTDWTSVLDAEPAQETVGLARLAARRYFPGFFVVLLKQM